MIPVQVSRIAIQTDDWNNHLLLNSAHWTVETFLKIEHFSSGRTGIVCSDPEVARLFLYHMINCLVANGKFKIDAIGATGLYAELHPVFTTSVVANVDSRTVLEYIAPDTVAPKAALWDAHIFVISLCLPNEEHNDDGSIIYTNNPELVYQGERIEIQIHLPLHD